LGNTPAVAAKTIIFNPIFTLKMLVNSIVKQNTLLAFFTSFGFLPLAAPLFLLLALPMLVEQLLNNAEPRWTISFHYSITIAPVLAIATIYGINWIKEHWPNKIKIIDSAKILLILACFVLLSSAFISRVNDAPILKIIKPSYWHIPQWAKDNGKIIEMIPREASVTAPHSFTPHMANRDEIYHWPLARDPGQAAQSQYFIFSLYGDLWPIENQQQEAEIIKEYLNNPNFGLKAQIGGAFLFEKGYNYDSAKVNDAIKYLEEFEKNENQ
jgi:uncharacterized membrane protein